MSERGGEPEDGGEETMASVRFTAISAPQHEIPFKYGSCRKPIKLMQRKTVPSSAGSSFSIAAASADASPAAPDKPVIELEFIGVHSSL